MSLSICRVVHRLCSTDECYVCVRLLLVVCCFYFVFFSSFFFFRFRHRNVDVGVAHATVKPLLIVFRLEFICFFSLLLLMHFNAVVQ